MDTFTFGDSKEDNKDLQSFTQDFKLKELVKEITGEEYGAQNRVQKGQVVYEDVQQDLFYKNVFESDLKQLGLGAKVQHKVSELRNRQTKTVESGHLENSLIRSEMRLKNKLAIDDSVRQKLKYDQITEEAHSDIASVVNYTEAKYRRSNSRQKSNSRTRNYQPEG